MKELEQGLGLEAGAVQVERVQMQKARHAEDVLRIARHLSADVSTTSARSHALLTAQMSLMLRLTINCTYDALKTPVGQGDLSAWVAHEGRPVCCQRQGSSLLQTRGVLHGTL